MARRRRSRVKRTMVLAALLALLALLLQLNQLLPGIWPGGGGGGGFRERIPEGRDTERLRPPLTALPPWPVEGITVVLRGITGGDPDGWRVTLDREGAEEATPDEAGRVAFAEASILRDGFVLKTPGGEIRHGPADPRAGSTWEVHVPPDVPPAPRPAGPVDVHVTAAESGLAVAGARLEVRGADLREERLTDQEGRERLEGLASRTHLTVEAEGRTRAERWVHPREGRVEIRVPRPRVLETRFVDPEGGFELHLEHIRVRTAEGRTLWEAAERQGSVRVVLTDDARLEGAVLEVGGAERPVVHVPLSHLEPQTALPRGRLIDVRATDKQGRPQRGTRVTAHYVPTVLGPPGSGLPEPSPVEVSAPGASIHVPASREARLLVSADYSAPGLVVIGPSEEPGSRDARLDVGANLRVRVLDAEGRPLASARVVLVASPEGLRIVREGYTGKDGSAQITSLPAGPIEVYAVAPGHAWAVELVELAVNAEPVRLSLEAGAPLRLIVEDPLGLPVPGVRIEATPEASGAPDVIPPDAERWVTSDEGTLAVDHLPRRAYRLRLSHPRYRTAEATGVQPGTSVHFVTLQPRE